MRVIALVPTIALALAPVAGWAQQPPAKKPPTPVVQPHGQTHAQKPATPPVATPAKPEPPAAPAVVAPAVVAPGAKPAEGDKAADAPKLPRFQSLRSNEVNLRAGPGTRYRIDWVYKRADLPVEVVREFEHWRAIRDADGIEGWVNQATLNARRHFVVKGGDATLRDDANDKSSAVATLKPGVIGRIRSCPKDSAWCHVTVAGHGGYLKRGQFWGTLPNEEIAP
jgi:SH3-like domain-containing protein